ncbi:hypothetical protein VP01_7251g1, partial [Puccinia sorghi]
MREKSRSPSLKTLSVMSTTCIMHIKKIVRVLTCACPGGTLSQHPESTAKNQSSTQHLPHQPISGEVKHLIEKEIFKNNKKQIDVAKTFGISDRQVRHIIDDARNNKNSASTNQRGAKSKLTTDIVTSILLLLEDNPSTTLKKLTEHVKNNHDIQVLPGEIQKMLKTIDMTWKTVTPIPR